LREILTQLELTARALQARQWTSVRTFGRSGSSSSRCSADERSSAARQFSDVLAVVLTLEPEWTALPRETPSSLRRLLERYLERNQKQRLRDVGEARITLASALGEGSDAHEPTGRTPRSLWR